MDDLAPCIRKYAYRYTNEKNEILPLVMHNFNFSQLVRLHRALSMDNNGSAMLISVQCKQMASIVKLTSFMLQYELINADCSTSASFLQALRGAVRIAGCDNKHCIVMIQASEIKDDMCLEAVNSLLSIGEYAPLFTDTEIHSLIVALLPTIKKSYSSFLSEPKRFFTSCIKRNLHFVIIASPNNDFVFKLQRGYPAIVTTCYIDWLPDASALHLQEEALAVLSKAAFWNTYEEELRSKIIVTCELVHTHHLSYSDDTSSGQVDVSKPTDALKNKILNSLQADGKNRIEINIITYKRFLHCLRYVLRTKVNEVAEKAKQRRCALDCLTAIEEKCDHMREEKTRLQNEFDAIESETERLQEELFAKSTLIERLKGKLDIGTGTFRAFMALMDNEDDEPEDDYVIDDERDELDEEYDKLKSASHVQIKSIDEKMDELNAELVELQKEMEKAEENLKSFQVKVDRGCIERLRAYQQPPTLVGTIMVMVMILFGRPEFASYVVTGKEKKMPDPHLSVTQSLNRASSASSRNVTKEPKRGYAAGVSSDGKVDRNTWKTIQLIMQDSQKFCEMMNGYDWSNGVSDDILRTVISFFAPGEEFPVSEREEGNVKVQGRSQDKNAGISLQAARYSSEDAASMMEYVQQVVNYSCKYRPYHNTVEQLSTLNTEKNNLEKKKLEGSLLTDDVEKLITPAEDDILDTLTSADLPLLEAELIKLQSKFDDRAMCKFKLKEQIREFTNLYETTIKLLKSLAPQKKSWRQFCSNHSDGLNILTNAIVCAACLSYGGPFDIDKRKKIRKELYGICSENGVPYSDCDLAEDEPLMYFLGSEIEVKNFEMLWPGTDPSLMDLTCVITQYECTTAWPLLCDPNQLGIFLLKRLYPQAVIINFYDVQNELEVALTQGYFVIMSNIDLNTLLTFPKLRSVIEAHNMFATASAPFKLMVGDKEIDCSSNFRLIMTTTFDISDVSAELSLLVNSIRFSLSRNALYEIFLNRFMLREKSRLEESLHQVNTEILTLMQSTQILEEKLLHYLVDQSYFDNISFIKKVLNTKKMLEEGMHNKTKAEEMYQTVKESREAFEPIAICAAVLFKVSSVMRKINHIYQISINQFLCYFDNSLKYSERNAVNVAAEKVLDSIYFMLSKAKLEVDRPLFGLFTALEIEDSQGRVSPGDQEYIISPMLGAAARQHVTNAEGSRNAMTQKLSMKKPFDWMTDEQYQNLLILSQNYDWFTEAFDKMPKDGREMQWRMIAEHDAPEVLSLPDGLDDKYTPLQRFMVLRAIRNDRFMQASNVFVSQTLGKKFAVDPILDLEHVLLRSTPSVPILMLYEKELSFAFILLQGLSSEKQVQLLRYEITGGEKEINTIMSHISEAIEKGTWLYLCNIHQSCMHSREIMNAVKNVKSDSTFRLWLSSQMAAPISVKMLHSSQPIIIDPAKLNLKYALIQNLSVISSDVWRDIRRPDWFPLLHNLGMLHSALAQRRRMGCYGVREPDEFDFDLAKFIEALKFVYNECSKLTVEDINTASRPASALKVLNWAAIKAYLLKMVYGREITNAIDYAALNALIEFWNSASSQRRDFELQRVHYKHPPALFGANTKSVAVILALEGIPQSVFESAEFCGLFNVPEVLMSTVTYCLDQLKFLRDNMFGKVELIADVKSLYSPSPTLSTDGSPSSPSLQDSVHNHFAAFSSRNLFLDQRFTELTELVPSLLQKLPRLWSKDFVAERIRKTGGLTAFNMWLLAETDAICVLHFTIKSSLQKIQELLTATAPYNSIGSEIMEDVIDIFNDLVPKRWCSKAGQSSPPCNWNISLWLSDFHQRCTHIEKVLIQGREKFAGYWMAAFFYPRRLVSVIVQEMFRTVRSAESADEPLTLKTEITNRDKDHLRDPASDGIFIYGLHLWGASREKATNELHDSPPKSTPYSLPVIHLQVVPEYDKTSAYSCPCYVSRLNTDEPVLNIDVDQKDVPPFRWALRGLCCTLRPF